MKNVCARSLSYQICVIYVYQAYSATAFHFYFRILIQLLRDYFINLLIDVLLHDLLILFEFEACICNWDYGDDDRDTYECDDDNGDGG